METCPPFDRHLFDQVDDLATAEDGDIRNALTTYMLAHGLIADCTANSFRRGRWVKWAIESEAKLRAFALGSTRVPRVTDSSQHGLRRERSVERPEARFG